MIKNEVCRISVGSLTYAMKSQKALTNAAIYSELVKLESGRGCIYGLEFSCSSSEGVRFVLKNAGIRFKEIST